MSQKLGRLPVTALSLVTLLMVVLCVIGGVRTFSPVPFWDMWDALYLQFMEGFSGLLNLHNEHRIVLARLLFRIDLSLFNGSQVFLIVMNYMFGGLSALLFIRIARHCVPETEGRALRFALSCLIVSLCFSWLQKENFTWAFQSQFFLAQLLPLLAFYLLYLATLESRHRNALFALGCLTGIACAGTMANGVLALPIMTLLALLLGLGRRRALLLAVITAVVWILYFHNFHSANQTQSDAFSHPLQVLHYILLYLGGPLFHLSGSSRLAALAGIFMLASCLYFSYLGLTRRRGDPLLFMLLAFLLYIGGSAAGAASGRLMFGLEQAFSGRYNTPTLMAWIALLILYARIFHFSRLSPQIPVYAALLLTLAFLPQQRNALENEQAELHQRLVGALAGGLGLRDKTRLEQIYPFSQLLIERAPAMARQHYAIYHDARLRDAQAELGKPASLELLQAPRCQGFVENIMPVEGDPNFLLIQGWMYNAEQKQVPQSISIIDRQGLVVGRALPGAPRPDVRRELGKNARYAGFDGYVSRWSARGELLLAGSGEKPCTIAGLLQYEPFSIRPSAFSATNRLLSITAIDSREGWLGSDPQKSSEHGYEVLGTFGAPTKAPRNVLTLNLEKGDLLYYRSSSGGSQQLSIRGHEQEFRSRLPVAPEWLILDFDQPALPQHFTLVITDESPASDSWAAVALRSSTPRTDSVVQADHSHSERRSSGLQ